MAACCCLKASYFLPSVSAVAKTEAFLVQLLCQRCQQLASLPLPEAALREGVFEVWK
jgi:hypothetical protein